jgi:hypothetical protein
MSAVQKASTEPITVAELDAIVVGAGLDACVCAGDAGGWARTGGLSAIAPAMAASAAILRAQDALTAMRNLL